MSCPFECITDFVFFENEPSEADVILVLGGSRPQLMERAIELYKQGYSQCILPSGGKNLKLPDWETEWDYFYDIAISNGIPAGAILKEDRARNTFDNARLSYNVLSDNSLKVETALLVCKAHHSRRALLTYQTVFPASVEFRVCPIHDERDIQKVNWFLSQEKIDVVMKEVEKIGQYFGKHIPYWVNP